MRTLLVSDLHYSLPQLDWVLDHADDVDLLVVAGDLLDVAGRVPLDAQITVVLEYLRRFAAKTTTVACSGNHDLDHRTPEGEKATAWITEAREVGVAIDGDSIRCGEWLVSACAWWEGPETLRVLEAGLDRAAADRSGPWLWAYHGPPEGPLSWTGSRHFGDPELPRLIEQYRPDVVLCGHIHEAPTTPEGGWVERRGDTWIFNSGAERGSVPSHIHLDLDERCATWTSQRGTAEVRLDDLPQADQR